MREPTEAVAGAALVATRTAWHAVADLVLAGPQYTRSGRIELRATPGGFGTVAAPDLRVDGTDLAGSGGALPLDGSTPRHLATAAGVTATRLDEIYEVGPEIHADLVLIVDQASGEELAEAYRSGDAALRALSPDSVPVLWPEHFDIAITVDEVNYGVSPGDGYCPVPYAYVGPWDAGDRQGDFWNAPFGAVRVLSDLRGEDAVAGFFEQGRSLT